MNRVVRSQVLRVSECRNYGGERSAPIESSKVLRARRQVARSCRPISDLGVRNGSKRYSKVEVDCIGNPFHNVGKQRIAFYVDDTIVGEDTTRKHEPALAHQMERIPPLFLKNLRSLNQFCKHMLRFHTKQGSHFTVSCSQQSVFL